MKKSRQFETIEVQGREIPIVCAFDRQGKPVPLRGDRQPEACDHAGATWSSDLDMRCPHCGTRLFLPPRMLARLPEQMAEQMAQLWRAAGFPPWHDGEWGIVPGHWFRVEHPLFTVTGGLPVLNTRAIGFAEAIGALP